MSNLRFVADAFWVSLFMMVADAASSQDYPNRPVRIITTGVGGANDFAARLVAQSISGPLGQQVVVENRAAVAAAETVMRAPPDGYTLLLAGGTFWIAPLLQKMSYAPLTDFVPISLVGISPGVLVVHPSLPVKSVKELIVLAKARPGELNYSSGSVGSAPQIAVELFKSMAGVDILHVPYTGNGEQLADLLSGVVHMTIEVVVTVMPQVKSGKLRALAVSSSQPSMLFPGLPTIAASGLPGYESPTRQSLWAPIKTPAAIIIRLNQEIVRALSRTDVKEKFINSGSEAAGSSLEECAATIKSEIDRVSKLITNAGIRNSDK